MIQLGTRNPTKTYERGESKEEAKSRLVIQSQSVKFRKQALRNMGVALNENGNAILGKTSIWYGIDGDKFYIAVVSKDEVPAASMLQSNNTINNATITQKLHDFCGISKDEFKPKDVKFNKNQLIFEVAEKGVKSGNATFFEVTFAEFKKYDDMTDEEKADADSSSKSKKAADEDDDLE